MQNKNESYSKRQLIGFVIALPLFIILLLIDAPEGLAVEGWRVFAIAVLMAILWMTESIPIPVTALLPLILFPFLGVIGFGDVAASYANSNVFLFMGGFFIAITMQKWGLHRRIALYLIWAIGSSPRRIILGFMVATASLSMWISNTATTMLLYPIGLAVILQLVESREGDESGSDKSISNFRTALMLGIAYAASIGGISTLVGTPPNIVFVSAFSKLYPEAPEISFFTWFVVGSLLLLLFLPICWIVLTRIAFRVSNKSFPGGRQVFGEEIKN
ncbi:anion permease, partial [candidate division KSB1 bacterium]|nr:anion permease [candidate division KSB1 bacterium]